jgi:hypothetical protein
MMFEMISENPQRAWEMKQLDALPEGSKSPLFKSVGHDERRHESRPGIRIRSSTDRRAQPRPECTGLERPNLRTRCLFPKAMRAPGLNMRA